MTNSLLITCQLITVSLLLLLLSSTLISIAKVTATETATATATATATNSGPTRSVKNTHLSAQRVIEQTAQLAVNDTTSGSTISSNASIINNKTNVNIERNSTKAIKQMANSLEKVSPEAIESPTSTAANQKGSPKRGDNSSSSSAPLSNGKSSIVIQDKPDGNQMKAAKVANQRVASKTNRQREYKLPSWFNYALYKRFYSKRYSDRRENELRKRIYLRTALKVFEQRALYRAGKVNSLSSINELSDMVSEGEFYPLFGAIN